MKSGAITSQSSEISRTAYGVSATTADAPSSLPSVVEGVFEVCSRPGYACVELFVHVALLFSVMMVHGIVFDDLIISSITPIPKDKNMNCTESCNYRGIALSSIFGKLIDRIILSRYADKSITSQHQFGFKKSHSTTMLLWF